MARLHRQADADDRLVAGDDRCQHVRPRRAGVFGHGERRRPCRDPGMQHGADMGVVAIEARAEGDVEKRRMLRIDRSGENSTCEAPALPTRPT